ncbi:MAG: ABC transporter permease [Gammaproteobacteria bacterium]|nr:ABC transporter permease [Gammaproteobacteria bacterium]MBV9620193.1 ABC transporter permease [Gammaproteobacteria bacterium]
MRALLTVFAKEFRENLRERRTLFSALIFGPLLAPALFTALLAAELHRNAEAGERAPRLAVAHAERAPNLLAFLRAAGVAVQAADYDGAAARAAVRAHRADRVLVVSEAFGASLARGAPAPLALYADSSDVAAATDTERVRAVLAQYGAELGRLRLLARGLDPLIASPLALAELDVSTPTTRAVLALGLLSYFMLLTLLMGGMYLAIDATAGERERGSLEPLLTLPVPRAQLIFGKILAACAYMTLSLVLTVSAFALLLRFTGLERFGMSVDLGAAVAARLVLYCLPFVPLGAALMTIVAAFTRTYREAQTYLGLVLLVPTLPLAFASALGLRPTLPLMAVPSLSQHFLIQSVLRDEPLPASYALLSVASSLLIAALLWGIAGRLYRREALLG